VLDDVVPPDVPLKNPIGILYLVVEYNVGVPALLYIPKLDEL
jgi:hypothetical protein